ncbi:hypothetical protein OJ997_25575 [Solirubrobacter phytolaccae]|uniref:Uncharacterized protein n=1 Tax=Solirubrobacter phytolaccae TaxID=1404360 RepID=A0A9X3NEX6_9ACTN|nr:hypothetical protein [Solirubrobacter phytolaccae]MDA0183705.1 hypothetical protein [Solirubrobacter phytolaccae]
MVWETFETALTGDLRPRLRSLSDRVPRVAELDPYRIAMNRLGLDEPTPAEAALKARLIRGGYRSRGVLADALLVATVDTGVGVWATNDVGPLRVEGMDVVGATLRVRVFAAPPVPVSAGSVTVFALVVPGVSELEVREALWIVRDALAA